MAEFGGHKLHVRTDVAEEMFVTGAEIIEASLAVGRIFKSVLRTFAIASKRMSHARQYFGSTVHFSWPNLFC